MDKPPFYQDDLLTLHNCECLAFLRDQPAATFDGIVTDPPYSSGGLMRSDRTQTTNEKYILHGCGDSSRPDFSGDNRDQRSFLLWATLWLTECFRVLKPGGYLLSFTDWRQLPTMSDAVQCAGFVWRGIVVWDKTERCRPTRGFFRNQVEYVLTATAGAFAREEYRPEIYLPGVFRTPVIARDKLHVTGKPTALMKMLLQLFQTGQHILDPFAGSGTTLLAAKERGIRATGCEFGDAYCRIAAERFNNPQFTLKLNQL